MRTPCIVVKSKQYDMKDIAIDNWDGELAKKRMESLIQTVGYGPNSERIDAILSPNDSIADGIIFTGSVQKSVGSPKISRSI